MRLLSKIYRHDNHHQVRASVWILVSMTWLLNRINAWSSTSTLSKPLTITTIKKIEAFSGRNWNTYHPRSQQQNLSRILYNKPHSIRLYFNNNNNNDSSSDKKDSTKDIEYYTAQESAEFIQARMRLQQSRTKQVRQTLQAASKVREFRIDRNWGVPEVDPATGQVNANNSNDGKTAVALTALVVAAGAVALRFGGRAALVSATGLDMFTQNDNMREQLQQILATAQDCDLIARLALFTLAWLVVKISCIDALGVALALSAGLLFGGVWQGALVSATAATIGSYTAFTLAQLDTPIRRRALKLLDDNPRLRGVEKVVAKDGLRAVLTLRLAPVLPIPIGAYNYIYACTNVPLQDFLAGIFLGSLKPYFLDSYLGIYVFDIVGGARSNGVDTTGNEWADIILLLALGFSVLIGVFASQLATETWESVIKEVEQDELLKAQNGEEDDGIVRQLFDRDLPLWVVGAQINLKEANKRMNALVQAEKEARDQSELATTPAAAAPIMTTPKRILSKDEVSEQVVADLCDSIVLTPVLWSAFLEYADPIYDLKKKNGTNISIVHSNSTSINSPNAIPQTIDSNQALSVSTTSDSNVATMSATATTSLETLVTPTAGPATIIAEATSSTTNTTVTSQVDSMQAQLQEMRKSAQDRIKELDAKLEALKGQ